ncbi:MAG TPA: hypothetical protein VK116_18975, partial [Planctomycetota bacterium]|nr:hypothetical protein [Planctomycetota bacterium]
AWYGSWITAPIGIFLDLIDLSENARRRSTALRRRMAADGISVPRIVRAALRERLEESAVFVDADAHSPDGVIHLSIEHGLDDGFGLRGSWRPWIEIRASLLDGEGAVHWRAKAEVPPSDDRLGELDAPFATPERLEAVYAKASAIAVDALLRHLAGE